MKRICTSALAAITLVGALLVTSGGQPASATVTETQPTKVALIILENQSRSQLVNSDGQAAAPFMWDALFNNHQGFNATDIDGAGSCRVTNCGYWSGVTGANDGNRTAETKRCGDGTAGCYASSSQQYAFLTSADNCYAGSVGTVGATDGHMNNDYRALPPTTLIAGSQGGGYCGFDVYKQLDDGGLSWHEYDEDNTNTTYAQSHGGYCINGHSESGDEQYARKHAPANFYGDISADCSTRAGTKVSAYPGQLTSDGDKPHGLASIQGAFSGVTFGNFTTIVPNLCHDMHNSTTQCSAAQFTDSGSSTFCNNLNNAASDKRSPADCWLHDNLRDITKGVGRNGVVIVTYDEGGNGTDQLAMFVVPGEDARSNPATLHCADGTSCANATYYDHASTTKALIDAFAATAGNDTTHFNCNLLSGNSNGGTNGYGWDNCKDANALPITLDVTGTSTASHFHVPAPASLSAKKPWI